MFDTSKLPQSIEQETLAVLREIHACVTVLMKTNAEILSTMKSAIPEKKPDDLYRSYGELEDSPKKKPGRPPGSGKKVP